MALEQGAEFAIAEAQHKALGEVVPQALSGFYPKLALIGNYSYEEGDQSFASDLGLPTESANAQLLLTQLIYSRDLGYQLDTANEKVALSNYLLESEKQQTAYNVAEAFFTQVLSVHTAETAELELKDYQTKLQQMEGQYLQGLAKKVDVLEAQVGVNKANAKAIQARHYLSGTTFKFNQLLGSADYEPYYEQLALDFEGEWATVLFKFKDDLEDKEVWLGKATSNTEVTKAKSNLELSKYDKEIQQSAHYPTLSLGVSATYFERYGLVPSQSEDFKISLEFNLPLFSGGATSSKARQSEANIVQARVKYRNALDLARLNIDKALDNLQHDKSYIKSLYAALKSSEVLFDATKKMHTMGLQSLVDVTQLRAQLKMTENVFLEALYGATLHRLELLRLIGSLTESELAIINEALTLTSNKGI